MSNSAAPLLSTISTITLLYC